MSAPPQFAGARCVRPGVEASDPLQLRMELSARWHWAVYLKSKVGMLDLKI